MTNVKKKRSGLITLTVLLLLACVILALCLLFVQNYLIFTADGIRFDFAPKQTTHPLNVVVSDKNEKNDQFLPKAVPTVLIEDALLPPL